MNKNCVYIIYNGGIIEIQCHVFKLKCYLWVAVNSWEVQWSITVINGQLRYLRLWCQAVQYKSIYYHTHTHTHTHTISHMDTNPHLWHLNSLHTSLLNSLLLLCCNSNVWIEKKQTSLYLLPDTVNDTKIPCMCAVYAKDYASVCAKGYAKVIRVKLCSQSYAGSGDAQPALPFRWLNL